MMESDWKQMEKTRENRVRESGQEEEGTEERRVAGREGVRPRWKIYSDHIFSQEKQSECPSFKCNNGYAIAGERESQSNELKAATGL